MSVRTPGPATRGDRGRAPVNFRDIASWPGPRLGGSKLVRAVLTTRHLLSITSAHTTSVASGRVVVSTASYCHKSLRTIRSTPLSIGRLSYPPEDRTGINAKW